MRQFYYLLISFIFLSQTLSCQNSSSQSIYSNEFKWSIKIPENYKSLSPTEVEKLNDLGKSGIENTYGEKVTSNPKIIFSFKNDEYNFVQASCQIYDRVKDGDFGKLCAGINKVLYETCKHQIPGVKIDTTNGIEKINNLEFHKYKMVLHYPNGQVLHWITYDRLFDEKFLTISVTYIDNDKGQEVIRCLDNSKFGK
ncbi:MULTISPECIES: hypothetical protein [unclassified Sphingobacterium]|uniref:hypothetical protein n=1 Tax=unclassified Sphingobacterium TaxID=2609468 RepID=UPI0010452E72|nr:MULTISPECIES: hypothetical protein [unclassified Sphingobacterium]MCS3556172.1 hypothetical protein [Sphingobacterium sp. JUb21]TCR08548.1 hypothetical protein EDF66_10395 [Sphingobacterium sp. JUb20]